MSPGLHHRPDDEHMNVPTWRMRQLQDIEHAALAVLEAWGQGGFVPPGLNHALIELRDRLGDD